MTTKTKTAKKPTKKTNATKKPAKAKAAKPAAENGKPLTALDAAAKVLDEAGEPMNCKAMIEAMAAKGFWTSPGGKTPAATLYAAILRLIQKQGKQARSARWPAASSPSTRSGGEPCTPSPMPSA